MLNTISKHIKFYDATNKDGICQKIDRLCDTDDTNYPRLEKTSEVNEALKELVSEIINADGTWDYDDTNHSDLPIGTGNLVEGQSSYSFASDYLQIKQVKVKDIDGNWHILNPIDQSGMTYPLEDWLVEDSLPTHYDKLGDTIRLYPAPTATQTTLTAGLKVEFKRNPQTFTAKSDTTTDTTEPGIAVNHQILAYMASLPYCFKYKPERVKNYEIMIEKLKSGILAHYGKREKDFRTIMRTKARRYK